MFRVKFFVFAKGWKDGGYYNTFYFETREEIDAWAKEREGILEIREVTEVPLKEALEDIIV